MPMAGGDEGSALLHPRLTDPGVDVARIARVLGDVPRVSYEAAHVYPLSAPAFVPAAGVERGAPPVEPLKLYVHVPFCNYACSFCFYAKVVRADRSRQERYVAAVRRELECVAPGTPLAQLYVGGGTPTALPADLLDAVLAAIAARMPAAAAVSRTVEASPESLGPGHVAVLLARGVERVSMGVESLDPTVLGTVGRHHTPAQAAVAVALLLGAGLVVNVDLMYGFPGQTEESLVADLAAVTSWGVPSVSLYNLRLNEHTPLARAVDDLARLDLARLIAWRTVIHDELEARGYAQTRWHTFVARRGVDSSFGRAPCVDSSGPGRQLGIGPSAVSHLGGRVYRNEPRLDEYLRRIEEGASPVDGLFALDDDDRRTLLVARTLGDGQPLLRTQWAAAFGRALDDDLGGVLRELADAGLVADDGAAIFLTASGRLVYDLVTLAFYPRRIRQWLRDRQGAA